MNDEQILANFQNTFSLLANDFLADIQNVNQEGMPEPFLPIFGSSYTKYETKIAVVGMETNGWGDLKNFLRDGDFAQYSQNCKWDAHEFEDYLMGNNGQTRTFWNFVINFMARFHQVDPLLVRDTINQSFMESFVWCNCNSIERLEVTNNNLGPSKNCITAQDWQVVKNASKRFDHGKHIFDVFKPDIMLITWWSPDESYLTNLLGVAKISKKINEKLVYMEFEGIKTKVIWTAHPTHLRRIKIEDQILDFCVDLARNGISNHI